MQGVYQENVVCPGFCVLHFTKPQADGTTELRLTPLELIDRIAALVLVKGS